MEFEKHTEHLPHKAEEALKQFPDSGVIFSAVDRSTKDRSILDADVMMRLNELHLREALLRVYE